MTPFKSGGGLYKIASYDRIDTPLVSKSSADSTYTVTISLPADIGDINEKGC